MQIKTNRIPDSFLKMKINCARAALNQGGFCVGGIMRSIDSKFYNSKAWEDCRSSYIHKRIAIDGGLCERCHKEPGYIVHHKVYLNAANYTDPSIALNHDNLEYLCHACHDDEHIHHSKRLLCAFDENGRPIPNGNT